MVAWGWARVAGWGEPVPDCGPDTGSVMSITRVELHFVQHKIVDWWLRDRVLWQEKRSLPLPDPLFMRGGKTGLFPLETLTKVLGVSPPMEDKGGQAGDERVFFAPVFWKCLHDHEHEPEHCYV